MEAVKEYGCFRQVLLHALYEGRRHVAGRLFDMHRTRVVSLHIVTDASEHLMIPAFGHIQRPVPFHIDKEDHLVMSPQAAVSSTPMRVTDE